MSEETTKKTNWTKVLAAALVIVAFVSVVVGLVLYNTIDRVEMQSTEVVSENLKEHNAVISQYRDSVMGVYVTNNYVIVNLRKGENVEWRSNLATWDGEYVGNDRTPYSDETAECFAFNKESNMLLDFKLYNKQDEVIDTVEISITQNQINVRQHASDSNPINTPLSDDFVEESLNAKTA